MYLPGTACALAEDGFREMAAIERTPAKMSLVDLMSGLMVCLSFGVSSGEGHTSRPALKLDTGKPAPALRCAGAVSARARLHA
jgi:hypothetical protein